MPQSESESILEEGGLPVGGVAFLRAINNASGRGPWKLEVRGRQHVELMKLYGWIAEPAANYFTLTEKAEAFLALVGEGP